MSKRLLLPTAALAAASVWCVALLEIRSHEFGSQGYPYLAWNLVLAWIPFVLAVLLVRSYALRHSVVELVAVGVGWLIFLPNAPYVVTDFIHLGERHRLFDSLLIASFAFTSLALGFASLLLVQLVVTRAAGALLGWVVAFGSLFAASVGIYLGRVLRFNSWDVIGRPGQLWDLGTARLADPFGNRYLIVFVLGLCGFLTLTYLGVYGFTTLAAAAGRREPPVLGSERTWPSP
jgi:uncharacterized membrane protein